MSVGLIWGLCAYVLGFFFVVVAVSRWRVRHRKERPPLPFRLLRGPGETLRRRVQEFGDDMLFWVLGAALAPLFIASLCLFAASWLFGDASRVWAFPGCALVLSAGIPLFGWFLSQKLQRWRDDRLGYLGERVVGERLAPLVSQGYQIFHDIPAEGASKRFNIDHVAVGPAGVAAIETKARRKRRARPGCRHHEVAFDGRRLIWPWGEDSHGVEQAIAAADWLRRWIRQRTGLETSVSAVLTLPGWYVKESPSKLPVRVVNSKILPEVIRRRDERVLTDEQIDLIARQLDSICRDVED